MEFTTHDRVLAFDSLFTTNQIQKLKIVMPYMDSQMQKQMAIYIKYMELQYTISFFKKNPYQLCGCFEKEDPVNFKSLCNALMPYTDAGEKKQLEQFMGIFQAIDMYKEFSQTFEMMKDFMPDMGSFMGGGGEEGSGNGSGDMMSMLMNMLSPEQMQMFEMFGGNNSE